MSCTNPQILMKYKDGKFRRPNETSHIVIGVNAVFVPCNKCRVCLNDLANEWETRCWLEALHFGIDTSQFITLTYANEHLPHNGVSKEDLRLFIKNLRAHFERRYNRTGIRYYACGEYGHSGSRPHYHVLLFNCPPFEDKYYYQDDEYGNSLYKSETLTKLWKKGECVIGEEVTKVVCHYVTHFEVKAFGKSFPAHFNHHFQAMSKQPGLGLPFLLNHFNDIVKHDRILTPNEIIKKLPKFFDDKIEEKIGKERFEEEIAKPRRERTKKLLIDEMKRTGLSEEEIHNKYAAEMDEKIRAYWMRRNQEK